MSRDLQENYYVSHGGKIPVKWTAPEVGRNHKSVASMVGGGGGGLPKKRGVLHGLKTG